MEVPAFTSSLNSNDVFLLRTQAEHYLWYGKVGRPAIGVSASAQGADATEELTRSALLALRSARWIDNAAPPGLPVPRPPSGQQGQRTLGWAGAILRKRSLILKILQRDQQCSSQ